MDVFFDLLTAITQGIFGFIILIGLTIVTAYAINREPNKMPILLFPIAYSWSWIGIGANSAYVGLWLLITGALTGTAALYNSRELVQRITNKTPNIITTIQKVKPPTIPKVTLPKKKQKPGPMENEFLKLTKNDL